MSNVKESPKGCGCPSCTRGKHTKAGQGTRNHANRSIRHRAKVILKKIFGIEDADIPPNRMPWTD